jgi:hypothetical protein
MLVYEHKTDLGRKLSVYLSDEELQSVTIVCDAPEERAVSHLLPLDEWDSIVTRIDSVIAERSQ